MLDQKFHCSSFVAAILSMHMPVDNNNVNIDNNIFMVPIEFCFQSYLLSALWDAYNIVHIEHIIP